MAYLHGLDGLRLAQTNNFEEGVLMSAALRRAVELREELDDRLAMKIRNQIAEAWNQGNS